jgi:hypothetical protein
MALMLDGVLHATFVATSRPAAPHHLQTADHHLADHQKWESWICSLFKKEAKKRAAEERAFQEQSRKRASHGCSSALAARRLLSIHTTSCSNESNWTFGGYIYSKGNNRLTI